MRYLFIVNLLQQAFVIGLFDKIIYKFQNFIEIQIGVSILNSFLYKFFYYQFNDNRIVTMNKSPIKSNVWTIPEDKLKIVIRIRPVLNQEEQTEFVQLEDNNTLQIKRPGNFTYMKFNNILTNYSTQKDVFNQLQQSIYQFLSGTNITIFAYGQTGAGKTYSIIGNYSNDHEEEVYHLLSSEQRGILSRSLEMIMENLNGDKDAKVFISFYQIYNDKIYDLYNKDAMNPLDIRESKNGEISIPNLITIQITKIQQAIHYLMIGLQNRSTGSTHANAKSSRSHSIFQIMVQRQNQTSSLRIVDLAGSQKFKIPSDITPAEKQIRIQQLTSINGSLSCLGHCISALIQKSRTHIPFRNSKLTRILSDSLLGQGKMRFVICISPSISASAETFSTLQFANRAKRAIFERSDIKTPPMSKKKTSQMQEIQILRKQLQRQRQIRMEYEEQLSETKKQNIFYKIQNQKLHVKVQDLTQQLNEHQKILHQKSKNINRTAVVQSNDSYRENNLKQEMLKLPIFQKGRQSNENSCSGVGRNKPLNQKKAEFQKKIRKFIEQNQPQTEQKKPQIQHQKGSMSMLQNLKSQNKLPSRSHQQLFNKKKRQNQVIYTENQQQNEQELDSLMNYEEQETQQFFQRACEKMNMKEYEDLKGQMIKAKNQLLKFKQIDDKIQLKKSAIR